MFGIEAWKPVLTALLLPPVPLLVLMLIGARLILPRRGLGWFVVLLSIALLWFSTCSGTAQLLSQFLLRPPAALTSERIAELKTTKTPTAIIVLGGGLEPFAPEYGVSNLHHVSLERLRYGVWLSRETGLPLGFSGGVGWAQPDATAEAQVAARIAAREFGRPLTFIEDDSRDTRENAMRTIALLRPTGIRHIVLVTNGFHMPRAQNAFEVAAAGNEMRIEAAPMGLARNLEAPVLRWLPSSGGMTDVRSIVRELLGRLAGA
ncbi:MAG: YdcF family protein [Pseudomonadota bacterium]